MRRPKQVQRERPKNVVIVGLAGAGKSSLVNLLCPHAGVRVLNGADHCTMEEECHTCDEPQCTVHDTIGLPEGTSRLSKIPILKLFSQTSRDTERLKQYLKDMTKKGELHLLIYCMSGRQRNKIESQKSSYQKFKSMVNGVPVVVVVTGLDECSANERVGWWERNAGERLGMDTRSGYHACITALPPTDNVLQEDPLPFYNQSCMDVKTLIRDRLAA